MGLSSATIKLSCNATVTGASDLATVQEVYAINDTLGTFSYGTGSNAAIGSTTYDIIVIGANA